LVRAAGEGSEVENLPCGEAGNSVEDDDHGAFVDWHRLPYMACQLSDFSTEYALLDIPHNAFEREFLCSFVALVAWISFSFPSSFL
jgi:hypothetical protein